MWNSCTVPRAAKRSCQVRTSTLWFTDTRPVFPTHSPTHTYTHSHTLLFCPCLPDQLLIVKRLGWLSSQDVDLTLEDRQLYFALNILLGFGYAVSHKITLRTVPETWGKQGNNNILIFITKSMAAKICLKKKKKVQCVGFRGIKG